MQAAEHRFRDLPAYGPQDLLLDRILSLTARVLDCRYAAFCVVHEGVVHLIAGHRITGDRFAARVSPCAQVARTARPLLVPDLSQHPLYHRHPWSRGMPGVHFYAAVPVTTAGGFCFGALSAMDPGAVREPPDWHHRLAECAAVLSGAIEAFSSPLLQQAPAAGSQTALVPSADAEGMTLH